MLAFFGFTPTMTVLDVGPGGRGQTGGYYTELLAPVLAKDGLYVATNREPPSTALEPSTHHWTAYEAVHFDELLRAAPDSTGRFR
jgi:predicted methyltransferase